MILQPYVCAKNYGVLREEDIVPAYEMLTVQQILV